MAVLLVIIIFLQLATICMVVWKSTSQIVPHITGAQDVSRGSVLRTSSGNYIIKDKHTPKANDDDVAFQAEQNERRDRKNPYW